ncbi:MAG: ANTAR domain-containing protein [Clostridiales bacterium]|nr:ANTAR domain-containing protein [Clostridiales bacterium]
MVFQERTYSVLVVSSSEKFNATTATLLPVTDFYPVTLAKSVSEAQRKLLERAYDIVIVNAPLPDDFGMRLAIDVCASSDAGVLLLVKSELYNDVYAKVVEYGVMTLSKPTSVQLVAQTLRGLCATRERMRRMEEKQKTVEEKIEELRLVNRAKWLLIECLNMSETDAHRYIEKQSMDLRVPKREVAENIIKTYK